MSTWNEIQSFLVPLLASGGAFAAWFGVIKGIGRSKDEKQLREREATETIVDATGSLVTLLRNELTRLQNDLDYGRQEQARLQNDLNTARSLLSKLEEQVDIITAERDVWKHRAMHLGWSE